MQERSLQMTPADCKSVKRETLSGPVFYKSDLVGSNVPAPA